MKKLLATAALLAISGCSTTFVQPENAKPVPTDRIFYQGSGDAQITVIRDDGFIGSGCFASLMIDGKKAALFETEEKATFSIEAGSTILGVEPAGDGICTWGGQPFQTETLLKTNEHGIYRIHTGQYSSGPVIIPVSKS